jgi:hypothetical protein
MQEGGGQVLVGGLLPGVCPGNCFLTPVARRAAVRGTSPFRTRTQRTPGAHHSKRELGRGSKVVKPLEGFEPPTC